MNPFKDIDPKIGLQLKNDRRSPYYRRFRLETNQVTPFREPLYNRIVLKFKDPEGGLQVYENLPDHLRFHVFRQDEIKNNKYWQLDFFDDETIFLVWELISDVIYVGMENYYFAFQILAPYLEDCHFFFYSTGDGDERWLDEYQIWHGLVSFDRHICQREIYVGRLDYYIERVLKDSKDIDFLRFTLYQLYDRLKLWTVNNLKKYPDLKSSASAELNPVQKRAFVSDLSGDYRRYFECLYTLDSECSDLESLEKKYDFKNRV